MRRHASPCLQSAHKANSGEGRMQQHESLSGDSQLRHCAIAPAEVQPRSGVELHRLQYCRVRRGIGGPVDSECTSDEGHRGP